MSDTLYNDRQYMIKDPGKSWRTGIPSDSGGNAFAPFINNHVLKERNTVDYFQNVWGVGMLFWFTTGLILSENAWIKLWGGV